MKKLLHKGTQYIYCQIFANKIKFEINCNQLMFFTPKQKEK